MNKKVEIFNNSFINYQYKVIDELIKVQEKFNVNDPKERVLYILCEGNIINLMFRLKGIISTIKEITGDEIIIPEKYSKAAKLAKEMTYFKGDELMMIITNGEKEDEMGINELIDKIKISKNGQQGKKDSAK